MKLRFSLITIAIMMAACSMEEVGENAPSPTQSNFSSTKRSYEEALEIAQNSIPLLDDIATTRSGLNNRRIDLTEKSVYKQTPKTRTSSIENDTLIYVFNFENNEGFALVSASKNTEGLLAITEKGHCNVNEDSGIEGYDMFIEAAKIYVANSIPAAISEPIDQPISIRVETIHDIHKQVSPKVSVTWGQNNTLGDSCSNNNAGCVNVALAQIMSYYQHPSSIIITYNNSNIDQALNWSIMRNHKNHNYYSPCLDHNAHTAIARLARQLGELNKSNYHHSNITSTIVKPYTSSSLANTIAILGYTDNHQDFYSNSFVRNELDSNHLIMVNGWNSNDGHTWIIDGYRYNSTLEYIYKQIGNGSEILDEIINIDNHVNHINWGWDGWNNGYYSGGVFDVMGGRSYDYGTNTGFSNNYTTIELISIFH